MKSNRRAAYSRLALLTILLAVARISLQADPAPAPSPSPAPNPDNGKKIPLKTWYIGKLRWLNDIPDEKNKERGQNLIALLFMPGSNGFLEVIPNFMSNINFVGLKEYNKKKYADLGVDECTADYGCEITNPKVYTAVYNQSSYSTIEGQVCFTFDQEQSIPSDMPKMAVNLMLEPNKTAPNKYGYGNLGLGPGSPYWNFLSDAYVWPEAKIYFKVWMNPYDNGFTNDWWDVSYYDNSQISINLMPSNSTVTTSKAIFVPVGSNMGKNGFAAWMLPTTTITAEPYQNSKKVAATTILTNKTACVLPDLPLAFYFKSTDPENPYDKLSVMEYKAICNGNTTTCYPSGFYWMNKGLRINFTIGTQYKVWLDPKDTIWFNGTVVKLGFENYDDLFAPGGPCEGASVALGARFFSKYSLTLRMDTDLKNQEFALQHQRILDELAPIRSGWMYFYIGALTIFLYTMNFLWIFRERKVKQKVDEKGEVVPENPNNVSLTGNGVEKAEVEGEYHGFTRASDIDLNDLLAK